jgi:hypothetical protein
MLSRLASYLHGFDRVVVACTPERQHAWALLLKGANIRGEVMLPESNTLGAIGLSSYHGNDTLVVSRGPLSMANRAKKRVLDLAVTVPALIALSPLFVLVAIAIKLESRGPVFFMQQRIGRSNQLFNILKFRSMRVEACDAEGNRSTERDDDRITRVGAFNPQDQHRRTAAAHQRAARGHEPRGGRAPMRWVRSRGTSCSGRSTNNIGCATRSSPASPASRRSVAIAARRCSARIWKIASARTSNMSTAGACGATSRSCSTPQKC